MTLTDALMGIEDLNRARDTLTLRATRGELLEISLGLHERKLRLGARAPQYPRIIAALARVGDALSTDDARPRG